MISTELQVVSLALAKKLNALGAPQDSLFYIGEYSGISTQDEYFEFQERASSIGLPKGSEIERFYSAYTVGELGMFLPYGFNCVKLPDGWEMAFVQDKIQKWRIDASEATTEADARAMLLIWLVQNKYIPFNL